MVESAPETNQLTLPELSSFDLVVLDTVPAFQLSYAKMENIESMSGIWAAACSLSAVPRAMARAAITGRRWNVFCPWTCDRPRGSTCRIGAAVRYR